MSQSPEKPWVKGKHPEYTALQLVLNICQDGDGNVWSDHDFPTPEDEALAVGLPQGGAPQLAHALLTEAVRREAFMCALIELTKSPDFLSQWARGSKAERAMIEGQIGNYASHVITSTLGKMTMGLVAEVLAMMVNQTPGGSKVADSG